MPYKLPNYEIDGTWNHHQSIILDSILDRIYRGSYSGCNKLPTTWWDKNVVDMNNNFLMGIINPKVISFLSLPPRDAYIKKAGFDDYKFLKEKYIDLKRSTTLDCSYEEFIDKEFEGNREYQEYLEEMQVKKNVLYGNSIINIDIMKYLETYFFLEKYKRSLRDYLKRIEETKFKLKYKIKYLQIQPTYKDDDRVDSKGVRIDIFYEMNDYQSIFKVDFTDAKIVLNFDSRRWSLKTGQCDKL